MSPKEGEGLVYTLIGFSSLLLSVCGSALTTRILKSIHEWSWRRAIQLLILLMPLVTLGLGLGIFHYLLLALCALLSIPSPAWLDSVFPIAIGLVALGAICFGSFRLLLMAHVVSRSGAYHHAALQEYANDIAQRLGVTRPRVLLRFYDRPLALTYGIFHPTILLSTWMVEQLDEHELEAVLAHELEHMARSDYLVILLATVLRDAFFYLPTSQIAFRQLQQEKELFCDDLAVRTTKRPLALASALTKVWLHRIETPQYARVGGAQPLAGANTLTDHRIKRLLDAPSPVRMRSSRVRILSLSVSMILALAFLQGITSVVLLAAMGCNLLTMLGKLL